MEGIEAPDISSFLSEFEGARASGGGFDRDAAAAVKEYARAHHDYVVALHHRGDLASTVNRRNSEGIDRLVRRLLRMAQTAHYATTGQPGDDLSIVAAGGYARQEMSVHSDIDLLFLYAGRLTDMSKAVAERVQYWLWDGGLKVGSAVRQAAETIKLAKKDETIATNILDARFLGGDTSVYHALLTSIWEDLLRPPATFVRTQREAMEARHAKFGESVYLLQPNLKEGAGGLRDYHSAYWIARATVPRLGRVDDFLHRGLLSEREMDAFRGALEFLWRLRNELHIQEGRAVDQMSFEQQERLAEALGYPDGGPGELPVERLMRDYYRHARALRAGVESVIEECRARLDRRRRQRRAALPDGFERVEEQLDIPHGLLLREDPLRLLRAFAVAQEEDIPLRLSALRLIREHLTLVDESFRRSPEAARIFDQILHGEQRVTRTLLAMNECGLLGAYLPEWAHIVCRWQHVMYHTYTVDVHSIFLVEELRRLYHGDYEDFAPHLTKLVRQAEDRSALFLGCLLHDIGKGFGGDHSERGASLARKCCERLGIEPARIDRAVFLVAKHLLMSHVAQRRDLSDPKVIVEFARAVGDRENLRNLYLATFADIRASSKDAWNEWKGRLLRELYERTAEYLEAGEDDPSVALEQIEEAVRSDREAAREALTASGFSEDVTEEFFNGMPRRYFLAHTPAEISRHAALVMAYDPSEVFSSAVVALDDESSEFLFCTKDTPGLYSRVAGALTAVGINILGSNVYTTRGNLALEAYRVDTPEGGASEQALRWKELEDLLLGVLKGEVDLGETRDRRTLGLRERIPSQSAPTVVVSNRESDFYTVIDVTANDRPGLLFDLTRVVAKHGLDIHLSKASTVLDQVADTFYVRDPDGEKVNDAQALDELRADLMAVVREQDAV